MKDALDDNHSKSASAGSTETLALLRHLSTIEAHLHLGGAIRTGTAAALARLNGVALPPHDEPQDLYRFNDLPSFLTVYAAVAQAVRGACA